MLSQENDSSIGVAQIGVGYWGPNLLRNFASSAEFNLSRAVDLDASRREFAANLYPSLVLSDDIESALCSKEIQAVCIATPADSHYQLIKRSLLAGKHVLVEKPLAKTAKQVEELFQIAKRENLVLMSGHTFVYNSAVKYLKSLVDADELGEMRYLYSQRLNLGRVRSDVDALWNFAPHDISILQFLFDDLVPSKVQRSGMSFVQEGIQDVVFLNLEYPNRVLANIHVSWLDPNKVRKLVLVGSKRMVVYDDIAENKICIFDKGVDRRASLKQFMDYDSKQVAELSYRSGDIFIPKIETKEPLAAQVAHFADCIRGIKSCDTGYRHTLGVIDILQRADYALEERATKVLQANS